LRQQRAHSSDDVVMAQDAHRSTAPSAGARTTGCRRRTAGLRRAPGQYGAARHARPQEDSEEPRGAAHGRSVPRAAVALGGAGVDVEADRRVAVARGRAQRRARRRPGVHVLLVHYLSEFFSKNLNKS
jgi:hypothetical protein